MSVWQEFLIGLAFVYPIDQEEIEITELVFKLFKILLHHAVKYEYGGWRVWIDTLSILHSRVAKEDYQLKMSKLYDDYEKQRGTTGVADNSLNEGQNTPVRSPSDQATDDDSKNETSNYFCQFSQTESVDKHSKFLFSQLLFNYHRFEYPNSNGLTCTRGF